MNEKSSKQIDVLDVQPAATAREQIGAAVKKIATAMKRTAEALGATQAAG